MPTIVSVSVIPTYALHLRFDDGVEGVVDLTGDLWGPMFEPLKDPAYFAQVTPDDWSVVWPNDSIWPPINFTPTF